MRYGTPIYKKSTDIFSKSEPSAENRNMRKRKATQAITPLAIKFKIFINMLTLYVKL
jgi:hypothetical protein